MCSSSSHRQRIQDSPQDWCPEQGPSCNAVTHRHWWQLLLVHTLTELDTVLNTGTNNSEALLHAEMKRKKVWVLALPTFWGGFSQEQMFAGSLYYIRLLWCFDRTQNVHAVRQLSLSMQHYLSMESWVYRAFVSLPINQLSLSGYQTSNLGNLNHSHSQWCRFLSVFTLCD